MFKPMAITVALALGGALLFSLTAFPALAATSAAAPRQAHARRRQGRSSAGRAARYDRLLDARAGRPRPVAGGGGAGAGRSAGVVAHVAGRRVRPAARRGRAVARHQAAAVDLDHRGAAAGRRGRGGAGALPRGAVGRDAHRPRRGRDRSGRPRRDRGDGQAAPEGRVEDRARSRRPRRGDQGGDRGRGAGDVRVGVAADRGPRQPAAGRARAPTSSSRSSARISTSLKKTADEIGKVVRDIPGPRRLARAARAGPAAARGQTRSAAAGPLRHERGPRAGGGRGVARRPLRRARSSRARAAST